MTTRRPSTPDPTTSRTTMVDFVITLMTFSLAAILMRCVPPADAPAPTRYGIERSRVIAGDGGPRYYLTLRSERPGFYGLEEREVSQPEYLRLHDRDEVCEYGRRLEPCTVE